MRHLVFEQLEARDLFAALPEMIVGTEIAEERISETGYFSRYDRATGFELWRTNGTAAGTYLVKDVNAFGDSRPSDFFELDGQVFFKADDGVHGREIWRTDGTAAGTFLVKDIIEGIRSPEFEGGFIRLHDKLFFATDYLGRRRLWVTDGAPDGTQLLVELSAGQSFLTPVVIGDVALFHSFGELWKTDGTAEGTRKIENIRAFAEDGSGIELVFEDHLGVWWLGDGSERNLIGISSLTDVTRAFLGVHQGVIVNETLYYSDQGALWRHDGSSGPTSVQRTDAGPNPKVPRQASKWVAIGDDIFVAADDGERGTELWKVNGRLGTFELVRDINPGNESSSINQLTVSGNLLYFIANDGTHGAELWSSDGTAAGTAMVQDISAGESSTAFGLLTPSAERNTVYFYANRGDDKFAVNDYWLWRSDGTAAGTRQIGFDDMFDGRVRPLTNIGGDVAFTGFGPDGYGSLFRSDGTRAGTVALTASNSWRSWQSSFSSGVLIGGTFYFASYDPDPGDERTVSLMKSDGTSGGTDKVIELSTGQYNGISALRELNGLLLFQHLPSGPGELWRSDGTEHGTYELGITRGGAFSIQIVADQAFVRVDINNSSSELWVTDGTRQGTSRIKEFQTIGPSPGSLLRLPSVVWNNILYFTAYDADHGVELWKTDGTTYGTNLVVDLWEGNSSPSIIGIVNDAILFSAVTDGSRQLWRTDGTVVGTMLVSDASGVPLSILSDTLFFLFDDGIHGEELWKTDGTPEGTQLVKDINIIGASGAAIDLIGVLGDSLIFSAFDGYSGDDAHGVELWKSDGTEAGTVLIKDLHPGIANAFNGSSSTSATVWNDEIYFVTTDRSSSGDGEVWKTDGTREGTVRLTDPSVTEVWAPRADLTVFSNMLYFVGTITDQGYLFSSDGPALGTQPNRSGANLASLVTDESRAFLIGDRSIWVWHHGTKDIQVPIGGGTVRIGTDEDDVIVMHNDQLLYREPIQDAKQLRIKGTTDQENFIIEGNDLIASLGILSIEGGPSDSAEHDSIELALGASENLSYGFQSADSGVISSDYGRIDFRRIDEFVDQTNAQVRRMTFTDIGDNIILGGGRNVSDNRSRIDFGNTEIDFINPTHSLLIDAGDGADGLSLVALDRGFSAKIEVARAFQLDEGDFVRLRPGWRCVRQVKALGNYFLEATFNDVKALIPMRESVWHNPTTTHSQWYNPINPSDVNGDGIATPLDVLLVINALENHVKLDTVGGDDLAPMLLDTNGDRHLSPIDALIIINEKHSHSGVLGEGEATPALALIRNDNQIVDSPQIFWLGSGSYGVTSDFTRAVEHRLDVDVRLREVVFADDEMIVRTLDTEKLFELESQSTP